MKALPDESSLWAELRDADEKTKNDRKAQEVDEVLARFRPRGG